MTHYREMVDNIRGYLASGDTESADQIAQWAEAYAAACRHVNDRLRKCNDALRRGQRSDAIHLAEVEPNLLDMVAALDFPEIAQWHQACAQFHIPQAPPLLIDVGAAINGAYAAEQPLVSLLARHRLLALARAPLEQRLPIMRQIAELDPAMPSWDEDIRVFETARLEQIARLLPRALRDNDSAAVSRLAGELNTPGWRTTVPAPLMKNVQEASTALTGQQGVGRLREILPKLNEAYSALAYGECKLLLEQWNLILQSTRPVVPADMREQVDPIVAWVAQEDQRRRQEADFHSACERLEQALDADQPTPALEAAYLAALRFKMDLSPELDSRYHQRLAARTASMRIRRKLIYAGLAAVVLIAGGIAALVFYQMGLTREIEQAQSTLAGALGDVRQGDPDKALGIRKQLTEQHKRILQNPVIIKSLADLDGGISAEKQREADFQRFMRLAEKSGTDSPDANDLQKAAALALTPPEKSRAADLQSHIQDAQTQEQQKADQQFKSDAGALGKVIGGALTHDLLTSHPDQFAKQLDAMSHRVEDLRSRTGITPDIDQAQMVALDTAIAHGRQDLQLQTAQRDAWRRLSSFGSTSDQYAAVLKQFISAYPDDPHCKGLQSALSQQSEDKAIEDWSALSNVWASEMQPDSYSVAKDRAAAVQQYLDQHADSPVQDIAKGYLDYLNKGLDVASPDGVWKTKIPQLLENPLVCNLQCLDTQDGLRYYVMPQTKVVPGELEGQLKSQSFLAITTPDITKPETILLSPQDPTDASGQFLKSTEPVLSPQADYVQAIKPKIVALDYADWDLVGIQAIRDLMDHNDMNPVLHAILLHQLLQANQAVSDWAGLDGFDKISQRLGKLNVEDMSWLDPRAKLDDVTQNNIQSCLSDLPSLDKAQAAILHKRDQAMQKAQFIVDGEGILLRSGQQGYEIDSSSGGMEGETAFVCLAGKPLVSVGRYQAGHWVMDTAAAGSVPEGSLVFMVAPPK